MSKTQSELVMALFEEQGQPLLKFLVNKFGSVDEAQEIAQEAWVRMFRLQDPDSLENPKAFLFQTASNLAIDRIRRSKLENRFLETERVEQEPAVDVAQTIADRQTLAILDATLSQLPEKCRQAFSMHRSHGMSYPEIAKVLGVSTSMVEKYVIQALKAFRQALAEREHG